MVPNYNIRVNKSKRIIFEKQQTVHNLARRLAYADHKYRLDLIHLQTVEEKRLQSIITKSRAQWEPLMDAIRVTGDATRAFNELRDVCKNIETSLTDENGVTYRGIKDIGNEMDKINRVMGGIDTAVKEIEKTIRKRTDVSSAVAVTVENSNGIGTNKLSRLTGFCPFVASIAEGTLSNFLAHCLWALLHYVLTRLYNYFSGHTDKSNIQIRIYEKLNEYGYEA